MEKDKSNDGRRSLDYRCDQCGERKPREDLYVKRTSFLTLARPQKCLHSRTVQWLCWTCVEDEPTFDMKPVTDSRAMQKAVTDV